MNTRTCAQMIVHELLIETQPGYRERRLEVEAETRRCSRAGGRSRPWASSSRST